MACSKSDDRGQSDAASVAHAGPAEAHGRIINVLEFLRDFQMLRFKEETDYRRQQWHLPLGDLPKHECVRLLPDDPGEFLKVRRPELKSAPLPNATLEPWIEGDWRRPYSSISVRKSVRATGDGANDEELLFSKLPDMQAAWDQYHELWQRWAAAERPAREARRIYDDLYDLRALFQREPEVYDLYVADGVVAWRLEGADVFHPLLMQRAEIKFDAEDANFTVGTGVADPILFSGVVAGADQDSVTAFGQYKEKLASADDIWPLADEQTENFLTGFANSIRGSFSSDSVERGADNPIVFRRQMLLCTKRGPGMAQFIQAVLNHVQSQEIHSLVLEPFVGCHPEARAQAAEDPQDALPDEDESVYFTKEANKEQLEIVRQWESAGSVVVQGPPGTGKTHTIANLIGHFLAVGNSILVTAQTTKALNVLRNQVVEPLRPLCVSILDSDREGRDLLESGMRELSTIKSSTSPRQLDSDIRTLKAQRERLVRRVREIRKDLSTARKYELVVLHACSEEYQPSEAARLVRERETYDGWIPGEIENDSVPPLSDSDLKELYASNESLTLEDEENDPGNLPACDSLPQPGEVEKTLIEMNDLANRGATRPTFWRAGPDDAGITDRLADLQQVLAGTLDTLTGEGEPWRLHLVEHGYQTPEAIEEWKELFESANSLAVVASRVEVEVARHGIERGGIENLRDAKSSLQEIAAHLQSGKRLSLLTQLRHAAWKRVLSGIRTSSGPIKRAEEAAAALAMVDLAIERGELCRIWASIAVPQGLPPITEAASAPERELLRQREAVLSCLGWVRKSWEPLTDRLEEEGFDVASAMGLVPAEVSARGVVPKIVHLGQEVLKPAITIAWSLSRFAELTRIQQAFCQRVRAAYQATSSPLLKSMAQAVADADYERYALLFADFEKLQSKGQTIRDRRKRLDQLRPYARAWAEQIGNREGVHGFAEPPGAIRPAWIWKLLEQELTRRQKLSVEELQRSKHKVMEEMNHVVAELAKCMAWRHLHDRITPERKSALERFVQATRVTTARRQAVMAREAKKAMAEAESAVPVWIMPLDRVAGSFDPSKTKFDVVIMDEASQIGLTGLSALHLARSAVIVGDDKQNEPRKVGIRVDKIQALQEAHLQSIPGKGLWDERMSIYRLAKISLSRELSLLEHFRCVPQIISYSSLRSYDGKIRPLRDDSSVRTKPFVVRHLLRDGEAKSKRNYQEALHVVSLLKAMSEFDEYKEAKKGEPTSFGCVVLRGGSDDQVKLIQSLVRRHLDDAWKERARFECGTSAHFQGDERDIVILSLVDAPEPGQPIQRLQTEEQHNEMYRKIYNVAASRAKDQLWVVSSLSPTENLQVGDVRRHLLEFAGNPEEWLRQATEQNPKAESEFERLVYRDLASKGYNLTPQFSVGKYRIDIVADCGGKRCAIECDGDRFHTGANLEKDMERQAILERCGWRFVRIRGTRYFRNPAAAIEEACEQLAEFGVLPEASETTQSTEPTDLLDRVLARAQDIRREWAQREEEREDALLGEDDWPFRFRG